MLKIRENIPIAPLTTFRIGGNAKYFTEIENIKDLVVAIKWANDIQISYLLLAGGSNVLISDGVINALVIKISDRSYIFNGELVRVSAGFILSELIDKASESGWGGLEKLYGIPGTIGGAVRGNAGAFDLEIKDFVASVSACNLVTGQVKTFNNAECSFTYRGVILNQILNGILQKWN